MERKAIRVPLELKLDDQQEGAFRAVFSTFNVVDHDGDVTLAGAFERGQKVRIAQWGHAWHLPIIGTGVIDADDEKAWVDGQFNLKTTAGRDHYETVKDAGDLQEWSYGFDILDWSIGQFDDREVRFLRSVKVHEVSPVMLGAGIGTMTEAIKAFDTLATHGKTLETHREALLAGARDLVSRYEALAAEGEGLSKARKEQVAALVDGLMSSLDTLRALITEADPEPEPNEAKTAEILAALKREQGRFLAYQARRNGVRVPTYEGA